MPVLLRAALLITVALTVGVADAKQQRSGIAKAEFRRAAPCPATGAHRGPCPGYQIDHVIALCAGGEDAAANMQWLAVENHKQKTRHDVKFCRSNSTMRMP